MLQLWGESVGVRTPQLFAIHQLPLLVALEESAVKRTTPLCDVCDFAELSVGFSEGV